MSNKPDNKSLFDFHMRAMESSTDSLSASEKIKWEQTNHIELPPLRLPERSIAVSLWRNAIHQWRLGLGAAVMALLVAFVLIPTLKTSDDVFRAKGSSSVTVFYERHGEVKPFDSSFDLLNGDKVGAQVISSLPAIAYWAVTDSEFKVISDLKSIEDSALKLDAGKSGAFSNSFELTAPNEGEHLVIAICTSKIESFKNSGEKTLFDRDFVSRLMKENRLAAESCMFVGYRLRGKP